MQRKNLDSMPCPIARSLERDGYTVSCFVGCDRLQRERRRYDVIVVRASLEEVEVTACLMRLLMRPTDLVILSSHSSEGYAALLARIRVSQFIEAAPSEAPIAISATLQRLLSAPLPLALQRIDQAVHSHPAVSGVLARAIRDLCADAQETAWPPLGRLRLPADHATRVSHLRLRYHTGRRYFSKAAAAAGIDLARLIRLCTVARGLLIKRRHEATWADIARLFSVSHSGWTNNVSRLTGYPPSELVQQDDTELVSALFGCLGETILGETGPGYRP